MKKKFILLTISIYLFISTFAFVADGAEKLPGYGADLSQTSVSGLSSGAFMSTQLHVAYSDIFIGAGIIAGGPYYCASSFNATTFSERMLMATQTCMTPFIASQGPDGKKLFEKAEGFAREQKIADIGNLKDDKVYIFSGSNDQVVRTIVVDQVEAFYKAAGIPAENIQYIKTVNSGHAIITEDNGNECSANEEPFISDCDFDQAHRILTHIYGELNDPDSLAWLPLFKSKAAKSGKIIEFDQTEFIEGDRSSMSESAYAYIPKSCETKSCKVHVAMHGCLQGYKEIKDDYYTETNYNDIADINDIIVLYPQAEVSKTVPLNPLGCWDFWGYSSTDQSNPDFYTREAPQMKAIVKMVKRLAEPRSQ